MGKDIGSIVGSTGVFLVIAGALATGVLAMWGFDWRWGASVGFVGAAAMVAAAYMSL